MNMPTISPKMDGHEDGNYLRKVLENGMHNCNHAAEMVAPADRVEVVGL
jgi:hypothetical protein